MNGSDTELWFGTTLIMRSPQRFSVEIGVVFQSSFTGASAISRASL